MEKNNHIYQQLKYHQTMIVRLQKWLLDCLIGLFVALLGILIARDHQVIVIALAIVAFVMALCGGLVGYGIYQGKQKFNTIMEEQRKS